MERNRITKKLSFKKQRLSKTLPSLNKPNLKVSEKITPPDSYDYGFQSDLAEQLNVSREVITTIMTVEESKANRRRREIFSKLDDCKIRIINALKICSETEDDEKLINPADMTESDRHLIAQTTLNARAAEEDAKWQRKKEQSAIISSIIRHNQASISKVSDMRDLIEWMTKFTFELTWEDIGMTNVESREIQEAQSYRSLIGAVQNAWECARRLSQLVELMMSDDTYDVISGKLPAHVVATRRRQHAMVINMWTNLRLRVRLDQYERMRVDLKDEFKRPEKLAQERQVTVLLSDEEPKNSQYKELEASLLREISVSWKDASMDVMWYMNETFHHKFTKKSSQKRLGRAMLLLEFLNAAIEGRVIEADKAFLKLKEAQVLLSKLKKETSHLQKDLGETQKLLYSARGNVAKMKKQLKTVGKENEKLLTQVFEFDNRVRSLERRLEDFQQLPSQIDYEEYRIQIEEMQTEISDLKQTVNKLRSTLEVRSQESDQIKLQLAEEKNIASALVKEVQFIVEEKVKAEDQADALRERMLTQEKSVASLTKLIVDKDKVIRNLKEEANELKRKRSSLKNLPGVKHFQKPSSLEKLVPQGMNLKGDSTMLQQAKAGKVNHGESAEESGDEASTENSDPLVAMETKQETQPTTIQVHTSPAESMDEMRSSVSEIEIAVPAWTRHSVSVRPDERHSEENLGRKASNTSRRNSKTSSSTLVIGGPAERESLILENQRIRHHLDAAQMETQNVAKKYEKKIRVAAEEGRRKSIYDEERKKEDIQLLYHSVHDETMRIQKEMQSFGNSFKEQLDNLLSVTAKDSPPSSSRGGRRKSSFMLQGVSSKGFLGVGIPDPQTAHMINSSESNAAQVTKTNNQQSGINPALSTPSHKLKQFQENKTKLKPLGHKYGPGEIRRDSVLHRSLTDQSENATDPQEEDLEDPSATHLNVGEGAVHNPARRRSRSPSIFDMNALFLKPSTGGGTELVAKVKEDSQNKNSTKDDDVTDVFVPSTPNKSESPTEFIPSQTSRDKNAKRLRARFGDRRRSSLIGKPQDGGVERQASEETVPKPQVSKIGSYVSESSSSVSVNKPKHHPKPDRAPREKKVDSLHSTDSPLSNPQTGGTSSQTQLKKRSEPMEREPVNQSKINFPPLAEPKDVPIQQAELFVKSISGMVGSFFTQMNKNLVDAIKSEKQKMAEEIEAMKQDYHVERIKSLADADSARKEKEEAENELANAKVLIRNFLSQRLEGRVSTIRDDIKHFHSEDRRQTLEVEKVKDMMAAKAKLFNKSAADYKNKSASMEFQLLEMEQKKQSVVRRVRSKQKIIDCLQQELVDARRGEVQRMFMSLRNHKYNYVEIQGNKQIDTETQQTMLSLLRRSMNYPSYRLCQMAKRYQQKVELETCINTVRLKVNKMPPALHESGDRKEASKEFKAEQGDLIRLLQRLRNQLGLSDERWVEKGRKIVGYRQKILLKLALLFHKASNSYDSLRLLQPSIQREGLVYRMTRQPNLHKQMRKNRNSDVTETMNQLHVLLPQCPITWTDSFAPTPAAPASTAVPRKRGTEEVDEGLAVIGSDSFLGKYGPADWQPQSTVLCPFMKHRSDVGPSVSRSGSTIAITASLSSVSRTGDGLHPGSYRKFKEAARDVPRIMEADVQAGLRHAKSVIMERLKDGADVTKPLRAVQRNIHPASSMFSYCRAEKTKPINRVFTFPSLENRSISLSDRKEAKSTKRNRLTTEKTSRHKRNRKHSECDVKTNKGNNSKPSLYLNLPKIRLPGYKV